MTENEEIVIDFRKIMRIVNYRKKIIIFSILIFISVTACLAVFIPKSYESEIKIMINKTNSTNISDANPFILSETAKLANNSLSGLISGNNNLTDEIELIKSPSVLDIVIKKNNLKYKYGKKSGKSLSADDFIKKNFFVSEIKGSSVLSIKYKSTNPKQTYNVLNDILSSYKEVYNEINRKKSINDNELIKNSYIKVKKELDNKISELKKVKSSTIDNSSGINSSNIAILGFYDKRIKKNLVNASANSVNAERLEREIDILTNKLKEISNRLEWSSTVNKISDKASKITVIKNPVEPDKIDEITPFTSVNILYAVISAILTAVMLVIKAEIHDKYVNYSDIDTNAECISSINFANNLSVQSFIIRHNTNNLKIISLADNDNTNIFLQALNNINKINPDFTNFNNYFQEHLTNLENKNILILTQIGFSDRKLYKEIKNTLQNSEIKTTTEFVFTIS